MCNLEADQDISERRAQIQAGVLELSWRPYLGSLFSLFRLSGGLGGNPPEATEFRKDKT